MDFPKRIEEILQSMGINQTGLAKKLNVSRGIISEFASGAREPSKEFLFGLSKLGISIDWFLTGKGEMYHSVTFDPKTETFSHLDSGEGEMGHSVPFENSNGPRGIVNFPDVIPAADEGPPNLLDADGEVEGARLEGARTIEMSGPANGDDRVFVDFYSGQQAGAGPAKEIEAYQPVTPVSILRRFINPWRPEQVKALEARGDSMTKIGLFDRDIVLFVPEEREGDGVYVISIENRMQVKRLEFDLLGKTLRIISENDRYEPKILSRDDEISRVRIEGKVIGWLHRHPY
jgi:SOS-response transcriptional repressor LexA